MATLGSPDKIAIGFIDGTLELYLVSKAATIKIQSWKGHSSRVNYIIVTTDELWTVSDDRTIKIWNPTSLLLISETAYQSAVLCIQFIDGKIISGSSAGEIGLWNAKTFQCEKSVAIWDPPIDCICGICVIGNCIWFGSARGLIYTLDKKTLSIMASFNAHKAKINAMVEFEGHIWSCSDDSMIKIWKLQTKPDGVSIIQVGDDINHHKGRVSTLVQVGPTIWSTGADCVIAMWNSKFELMGQLITPHDAIIRALCNLGNDKVVCGGYDKAISLWSLGGLSEYEEEINMLFKRSCITKNFAAQRFEQTEITSNWRGILLSLKLDMLVHILRIVTQDHPLYITVLKK